jgi:hypothetical protein
VPIEVLAGTVISHRGFRISMAGGDLDIAEADAGVEHGRDERVPQHVWMHPRYPDPGGLGQMLESAGGGVAVHAGADPVEQDRPGAPVADRAVDGPTAGGSGTSTILVPLPRTRSTRWPCSSPMSSIVDPQASKIRSPSRPSIATNAKSNGLVEVRAATIMASNCKWDRPRVGDSAGTGGRRT